MSSPTSGPTAEAPTISPVAWVADELDHPLGLAAHHRLAVVGEGVAGHADALATVGGLLFGEADVRHLGVGEQDEELEPIVDLLDGRGQFADQARGVAGGEFGLLDGDVDDLVGSGHVASGEDVPGGAALVGRDAHRALLAGFHPGTVHLQVVRAGDPTQGEEHLLRADGLFGAATLEPHALVARLVPVRPQQVRAALEADTLVRECVLQGVADVGVGVAHDVVASLEDRHLRAQTRELMRRFQADGPGSEDDDRGGEVLQFQGGVAVEAADVAQAGHGHVGHLRARGDEEGLRLEGVRAGLGVVALGRDDAQGVGVHETGQAADVVEFAVFQLPAPVTRELADEPLLARLDFRPDNADVFGAQTVFLRAAQGGEAVGAFDHRLAGHAAAQDAQAAHVLAAFNEGSLEPQAAGGARGGETGAAAADHDEIVGRQRQRRESGRYS